MGLVNLPAVDIDGHNWPVSFAAEMLDIPPADLRDLIRILGVQPSGIIKMADFRRQGRHPYAYPAATLIRISEAIMDLAAELSGK